MNILIALDSTEESFESIKLLSKFPFKDKPNVMLLSAYSDAGHHSLPEEFRLALVEQLKGESKATLAKATEITKNANWNITTCLSFGHPKSLIIDKAVEFNADLIAVGAVGHSAMFRILLGSTADYVANHAQCSVLVARPSNSQARQVSEKLNIVLAYDGSERANTAMSQLAAFNWSTSNSNLHSCRILERPELLPEEMIYDEEMLSAAKSELQDMTETYPALAHTSLTIRESTHVSSSIAHEVTERKADVLFVGDSGKSTIGRLFLGSVSRYLLHHVPNSVWIARAKSWKKS